MTIECYNIKCKKHSHNEMECQFEPKVPAGYTEDELERDNPYNQWMKP